MPTAARAAPTVGSNGAVTTCGDSRRGVTSAVAGSPSAASCAVQSAAAIATVGPWPLSRSTAPGGERPVADQVAPRVEVTPRIWSTMSPAPLVGDRAQPGVTDALQRVQVGLRVRRRRDAHPMGQRAQPVQPGRRRGLPGAGMGRRDRGPSGFVGHDVAGGHRVDGHQQVRVDGQAQRARRRRRRGRPAGWSRTPTADSSVSSRPPGASDVARSSSISRTGVVPPGAPAASRGWSASGHSIVTCDGLGGVGRDDVGQRVGRVSRPGRAARPSTGSRKRASSRRAGVAVVGCAVDVDQQRVHAGLVDAERRRRPANAAGKSR